MPIKQCDQEVFSSMVFAASFFSLVGIFSLVTIIAVLLL